MAGDTIQIAGHAKESGRWERLQRIAVAYGGSATRTVSGNCMNVRLYGKLLVGLVREFVSGKTAINKHIAPTVWRYSDRFLVEYMRGYLEGDGHWEEKNQRWRLGFCRNYALEQDLRTACARLDWKLTINPTTSTFQGGARPSFKGELRMTRSGHHNERSRDDVVRIERGRCRWVYDVGVEDDPHLFALASGILTHNSKPNPMPESVTDRCTKSHEYIFMLTKNARYYYDAAAIAEPVASASIDRLSQPTLDAQEGIDRVPGKTNGNMKAVARESWNGSSFDKGKAGEMKHSRGGLKQDGHGKHHAGFNQRYFGSDKPYKGQSTKDYADGGAQDASATKSRIVDRILSGDIVNRNKRSVWTVTTKPFSGAHFATFPPDLIEPCILAGSKPGDTVLDPFGGSGTTGMVAEKLGRQWILIELNPTYEKLSRERTAQRGLVLT